MHTLENVRSEDFEIHINNKESTLRGLFPGFNNDDRVGIVTRTKGGVLGVSVLLMGAVANFYDHYRGHNLGNEKGRLRIYPEYFIFHVDNCTGTYGQLDIWPPYKEAIIEDDAEQILEAINERGITQLLIEEGASSKPLLLRESLSSAEERIKSVHLFSPTGKMKGGDVSITNSGAISDFILKAYEESMSLGNQSSSETTAIDLEILKNKSRLTQTYQTISLREGIKSLTNQEKTGETTEHYIETSAKGASVLLE